MSSKKQAATQQSHYQHDISKMPEGYYSSGPNPNLRRFVEQHAAPYDPATDDYKVSPFDQPIITTKATAIYNMHTYWSKKPHDAIRQYIRHYTQPGDLVLDPFCGSGGTALAALMEGRKAIAIDLSPAATFIAKNYCTPVDVNKLQHAFAELQKRMQLELNWLYETCCDRCEGRATTVYTVYSQVFRCERCLSEVPFFDCKEMQSQTAQGKPKTIRICPICYLRGHQEEIKTDHNEKLGAIPVLVTYECMEGCKPKRSERRYNDTNEKKRLYFKRYDLGKLTEIETKIIPYWYPPHRMMNVESDTEPWGDKWRAGTSNFRTVAELFTKRNLWALGAYNAVIQKMTDEMRDVFQITFTGSCLHGSRMSHFKEAGGGISVGTYYLPQLFKEQNIMDLFARKFTDIQRAKEEISLSIVTTDTLISTQSTTHLEQMPSNSIDYLFIY